jgi:hypothetical protein
MELTTYKSISEYNSIFLKDGVVDTNYKRKTGKKLSVIVKVNIPTIPKKSGLTSYIDHPPMDVQNKTVIIKKHLRNRLVVQNEYNGFFGGQKQEKVIVHRNYYIPEDYGGKKGVSMRVCPQWKITKGEVLKNGKIVKIDQVNLVLNFHLTENEPPEYELKLHDEPVKNGKEVPDIPIPRTKKIFSFLKLEKKYL